MKASKIVDFRRNTSASCPRAPENPIHVYPITNPAHLIYCLECHNNKGKMLCEGTLGLDPKQLSNSVARTLCMQHPYLRQQNSSQAADVIATGLALWDTAGQEDYERLRPLAYAKAHVILIGFSVDTPDSLDNVKHKWVEEANERCPGVPIILVGLKKDLREDPLAQEEMRKKSLHFTTDNEGSNAAREIGARKYLECSSLTGEGVDDVFEAATRAALLTFEKGERGGCCVIL
ncbi:MAG: hypothetical protein Q9182_007094 [Xanthomendoza sp. 2 TL-2023]